MNNIKDFIEYLGEISTNENAENLYAGNSLESKIRRNNLSVYLTLMQKLSPTVLLVGEAPGHRGCKLTGIPFTSERILNKENYFGVLGEEKGYEYINSIDKLQTEASAAFVWNELKKYRELPVMWNIYPFHPFPSLKPNENRSPSSTEIKTGKEILIKLIKLFEVKKIGAIGRLSESGINSLKLNVKVQYVRHPSFGGQTLFAKGLSELINSI